MNQEIYTIYHATYFNINEFNLDFLEAGEHEHGIGIYFKSKNENLNYYFMDCEPDERHIYEIKIPSKNIVSSNDLVSDIQLINILNETNHSKENKIKIYNENKGKIDFKNIFFLGGFNSCKETVLAINKHTGIDGLRIDFDNKDFYLILTNPECILEKKDVYEFKDIFIDRDRD